MFKACKHLIFDQSRLTCELVGISNHLGWERRDPEGRLQLCQFCELRGRLNYPQACIGKNRALCHEYEEIEWDTDALIAPKEAPANA